MISYRFCNRHWSWELNIEVKLSLIKGSCFRVQLSFSFQAGAGDSVSFLQMRNGRMEAIRYLHRCNGVITISDAGTLSLLKQHHLFSLLGILKVKFAIFTLWEDQKYVTNSLSFLLHRIHKSVSIVRQKKLTIQVYSISQTWWIRGELRQIG